MRLIEDINMVDRVEDWSRVRSPSRAERRRRQGHRQNIRIVAVPKKAAFMTPFGVVMHPAMAAELRNASPQWSPEFLSRG